jgi:hypothetical protein
MSIIRFVYVTLKWWIRDACNFALHPLGFHIVSRVYFNHLTSERDAYKRRAEQAERQVQG